MKKFGALFVVAFVLLSAARAFAQNQDLVLHMSRDFGFAGFSNDIEGLFSVSVDGPQNLAHVDFYLDEQVMASVDQAPFRYQFSTKSYAPGEHRLYAIGTTTDGQQLQSNEFVRVFLTADEARNSIIRLIIPILGIVIVVAGLSIGLPMLFGRGKPQLGKYGISGGAVCPKCGLPFPIHMLSFHAGFKNLERCPHCGKWVWVRKASKEDLTAAEARWRGDEKTTNSESGEDKLKRQIDDSRYDK